MQGVYVKPWNISLFGLPLYTVDYISTLDINKRWRDQFTTCVSIHVYINPEECFGHLGALIQFCFNNETDLWSCKPDLLFVFG